MRMPDHLICLLRNLYAGQEATVRTGHRTTTGLTSLGAQMVQNLPAMLETQVPPLGHEDPLEKEMATHSSMLAWEISWIEEPGRLKSMRLQSWT